MCKADSERAQDYTVRTLGWILLRLPRNDELLALSNAEKIIVDFVRFEFTMVVAAPDEYMPFAPK